MSSSSFDPNSGWSSGLHGSESFPNPWFDMASVAMPEDNRSALRWCEYIFSANATYRMAMERVIAYFLTDVDIGAVSKKDRIGEDEKEKWQDFLDNQLHVLAAVHEMDRDRVCYGNAFATIHVPFRRFLVCPRCGLQVPLRRAYEMPVFKFKFTDFEFLASCPACKTGSGYHGKWTVKDEPENLPNKLRVKRWSPHDIYLLWDHLTDDVDYLWKIPEDYKRVVRQGRLFHLERVGMPVLDAIKQNQLFRFADNVMYHMKEPTLGGIKNRGWGISRTITNFRQVWYVQVLHRYNEAIAMDYVIPFRLITPSPRGGSSSASGQLTDPLLSTNMGDFMGQVRSMVRRRRRDPSGWNTLPFPVQYQALGGDANQLAPSELLNQGLETLLNASGTPVELYKGTLQLQTAPVALRLFEATWNHLVSENNSFLGWVVGRVAEILSWEQVSANHKRVTHADDMQRQMAVLQLMGNAVSKTTGLKTMGIDFGDEVRRLAEDARTEQEVQTEMQKEMDQTAYGDQVAQGAPPMGGGAPGQPMDPAAAQAGGQPGQPPPVDPATGQPVQPGPVTSMISSGNVPVTPEDMMAQASSIANELLGMPESQKDSELRQLKQKNEVLHALVLAELKRIRQSARSQGGQMLLSQEYGA